MGQYLGIVAITAVAGLISGLLAALAYVLGPKRITPYKQAPYECGVAPVGDAKERFPIKFYLVAIIFILFDIEVVFLWAWMTVYKAAPVDFMQFTFIEFMTYMSTWILGYIYAVKVGAIDWDETTALSKEKLGDLDEEENSVGQPVLGGVA